MDEARLKLKCNLATALSDMGLISKLPAGRIDLLVDTLVSSPDDFRVLSESGIGHVKSTPRWRAAYGWAMTMSVPTQKKRKPREPRPKFDAGVDQYGQVFFKKRFIGYMKACGRDWAKDAKAGGYWPGESDGSCEAVDMADGLLTEQGVQPDLGPKARMILKECMADYIYEGILSVR